MKINELSNYIAGFATGAILAVIIASWSEATMAYRIVYVVLLGLVLLFATWSKPKSNKGNNNADDNSPYALVCKPSNKSNDSTAKS